MPGFGSNAAAQQMYAGIVFCLCLVGRMFLAVQVCRISFFAVVHSE
jgi:hypothetical protein